MKKTIAKVCALMGLLLPMAILFSPTPASPDGSGAMGKMIVFIASLFVSAVFFLIALVLFMSSRK